MRASQSKTETQTILQFIRRMFRVWIEKADKETLHLIRRELGQMERAIAGRLKE